jgi:hypothetical protein
MRTLWLLLAGLLLCSALLQAEEIGVKTVTETAHDGTALAKTVVFTGTEHITLEEHAAAPSFFRTDTGELWVDRNHRYAIVQNLAIQGDGLGIYAYWDLNNQRTAYYRTLGQNTPVWESPGVHYYTYGGHQIGASRHGEALASAALDQAKEWSKLSGIPRWSYRYPTLVYAAAKVNSYGTRVAVATALGRLYVLDAQTGDTLWTAPFNEGSRLQGVTLTCDGTIVAVTVYDSCFVFENGNRRGAVPIGTVNCGTQYAAKLSTDGKYLVTGDYYGRVRLYRWSGTNYDLMWNAAVGNPWVTDVNISKDGSTIAAGTGYSSGKAVVFDSSSATPLWVYQGFGAYGAEIASCALSQNGSRIAFASWGDTVQSGATYVLTVHDRSSSNPLCGVTRDEEVGSLFCCDISGDGQYVTAGGKAVHAYRMGNGGQVYAFLIGHTPTVNVGVDRIVAPGPYLEVGAAVEPQATITNYGDSTVSFKTFLTIRNPSGTVFTDSQFVTDLAAQASQDVYFSAWTPDTYNFYDFVFATALSGDQYSNDDSLAVNAKCFHDAGAASVAPPFDEMTTGYELAPIVKAWNSGSYTDDVSVNVSIRDSLGGEIFAAGTIVNTLAPGESALVQLGGWPLPYAGRYSGIAWARAGDEDFIPGNDTTRKSFVATWELIYDDGIPEAYYWAGRLNNDKFYVKFTPTASPPFTLTGGRIYVNLANQPFAYVSICKDDGNGRPDTTYELQRVTDVSTPVAPAWSRFDLDIPRADATDLWLVVSWYNNSQAIGIGADATPPRDYRSYWSSNQDTFQLWSAHDWMIRLTQVPQQSGLAGPGSAIRYVFALGPSYPNPFRRAADIAYSLGGKSQVRLAIFDHTGRQVRTLLSTEQQAGNYRVRWNGADDLGRTVPAGVYFCRMKTSSGFTSARKLTLLR